MSDLSIQNLSLTIIGEKKILQNVSADMNKGELVGLIGPNDARKSSFLKALLGLYNKEPT